MAVEHKAWKYALEKQIIIKWNLRPLVIKLITSMQHISLKDTVRKTKLDSLNEIENQYHLNKYVLLEGTIKIFNKNLYNKNSLKKKKWKR